MSDRASGGDASDAGTAGRAFGTARLEAYDANDVRELERLDWQRSTLAEMGGYFLRPNVGPLLRLVHVAGRDGPVGVVDAVPLAGYPGVVNATIFIDARRFPDAPLRAAGVAMSAYKLHTELLFEQGARLVHYEVLEMNRAVRSLLRRYGFEPTARLRQHAYVAARWWDVLVYSFGPAQWRTAFERQAGPVQLLERFRTSSDTSTDSGTLPPLRPNGAG